MKFMSRIIKGVDTPCAAVADIPFNTDYEAVGASQAGVVLGSTGAIGDVLSRLIIVPSSTSPGAITIQDGTNAAITVFPGGATSVQDLKPYSIELGLRSVSGPWKVTTGANVSAVGIGNFT